MTVSVKQFVILPLKRTEIMKAFGARDFELQLHAIMQFGSENHW